VPDDADAMLLYNQLLEEVWLYGPLLDEINNFDGGTESSDTDEDLDDGPQDDNWDELTESTVPDDADAMLLYNQLLEEVWLYGPLLDNNFDGGTESSDTDEDFFDLNS